MHLNTFKPQITVLMPTYNQVAFITRAIRSLQFQSFDNWNLIILNDGSTDNTKDTVETFLDDKRISYVENKCNFGLGYTLNKGLTMCRSEYVGYLPSDDIYYKDHLQTLFDELSGNETSIMAFSGISHRGNSYSDAVEGYSIQLVQVLHRKTACRWIERTELVTDSLDVLYWEKLLLEGDGVGTGRVTCEWVDHPLQRHKIINDRRGGNIFYYKKYYGVKVPIKYHPTGCNYIDEKHNFRHFRDRHSFNGLKILLVGELAYNPERIYALEERGHKLYGLWIDRPENFNAIGELPFGNIETISGENWREKIRLIKPDLIYALLNHQAISLAHSVLVENFNVPFIWHFKEGPFYSLQFGTWDKLIALLSRADGVIYNNELLMDWFKVSLPFQKGLSFILDGDLPKSIWFSKDFSPLLSEKDGEIHTVFAGRPFGVTLDLVKKLADAQIHMHFYGDIFNTSYRILINNAREVATKYIHTHPNCVPENWVREFSQYDAGWLHHFKSQNGGELLRAKWEDLNSPARLSTYACAGLPMIQFDNKGNFVHSYDLVKKENLGVCFKTVKELSQKLRNKAKMTQIRENVIRNQHKFCFDYHVDGLIEFFRQVIAQYPK